MYTVHNGHFNTNLTYINVLKIISYEKRGMTVNSFIEFGKIPEYDELTWQVVCVKYHTRGLTLPCGESTFSNMWSGWKYGRNRASCRIFWWNWIHGQLYKNIVVKIYFSIFNETNKNVLVKARYFVFDLTQLMSFCSISEHKMIRFLS